MINLIKNEIYKIIKKKYFIIFFIIIFAFMTLIHYLSANDYQTYSIYTEFSTEVDYNKSLLDNADKSDIETYTILQTNYLISSLKYENTDTWLYFYLNDSYDYIYNYYYYLNIDAGSEDYYKAKILFDEIMNNINENNWIEYVNVKITSNEEAITLLNSNINDSLNKDDVNYINNQIYYLEYENELLNKRIIDKIDYSFDNFVSEAMNLAILEKYDLLNTSNEESVNSTNEMLLKYEYVIEHNVNSLDSNNINNSITSFMYTYGQLFILFVLVIAGTILSNEFTSGTIKTLLVSPYSRTKILISKFISTILLSLFIIFTMLIFEIILSSVFYNISDLAIPYLTYNQSTNLIVAESSLLFVLKQIIVFMPTIIFYILIALSITVVISNSALAIVGTFMIQVFGEMVNLLIVYHNLDYLNYFITLNWDFTCYLYGGTNTIANITLGYSIVVYLIYFIIISFISIKLFKIKNISNV